VADPSALFEAARQASPLRHVALLLGAGLLTGLGQWLLTRLTSGNGIEITAAIWFQAGRLPALRTLGSAVLSIVIVGMGAPLGREGAPKQFGAVFGNLASDLQKLSDEQRRLMVAIGAGAGMAAVSARRSITRAGERETCRVELVTAAPSVAITPAATAYL